jgi:DNA-binding transcriptional regulator LsrR (DeoR family)
MGLGAYKAQVVIGSIHTGAVNHLIIDTDLAEAIIRHLNSTTDELPSQESV